ncbi:MAG TPA: serine hydrolase domain-containing protein [Desulfomonilia bacterium]
MRHDAAMDVKMHSFRARCGECKALALMKMFFLCIAFFAASIPVHAGSGERPSPIYMKGEHVLLKGGVPANMKDLGDRLEVGLDTLRARYRVAGVAVAMVEGVHAGDASAPAPRLIQSGTAGCDPDGNWHAVDARTTLFGVASLTKLIVAWALIHNQAELGIDISRSPFESPNSLDLDGCEWNPWKGSAYPTRGQGFTLNAVIQHKAGLIMSGWNSLYPSGWPAWLYGPENACGKRLPSLCRELDGHNNTAFAGRMVFRKDLVGKFTYSSGNYGLLQMLIEQKASPKDFDAYMQDVMEKELNMHRSTFDYDPAGYLEKRHGREEGLWLSRNYKSYTDRELNREAGLRLFVNKASGGLFSTVEDYAAFAMRMMQDGIRPGTPEGRYIFCDNNRLSYYDPERFPTSEGFDVYIFRGVHMGWASRIILDPAHGNAIVIFANTADPVADRLGCGTGENLIREVFDAFMLTSGYGQTLRRYHAAYWGGKTVKACEPYYGE